MYNHMINIISILKVTFTDITLKNKISKHLSQHLVQDLSLQLSHFTDLDIFNLYIIKNEFLSLKNKNV